MAGDALANSKVRIEVRNNTCKTCRFSFRDDEDLLECRRFPPLVVLDAAGKPQSFCPMTDDDAWCGEWSEAAEDPGEGSVRTGKLLHSQSIDYMLRYPRGRSLKLAKAGHIPFIQLPDGEIRFEERTINQLLKDWTIAAKTPIPDLSRVDEPHMRDI